MSVEPSPRRPAGTGLSGSATLVAAGILTTRIAGFVRVTLFSAIFGIDSNAADAFNAALRIPNFLQNLLGEGVLSASLIPVYASLLKKEHQARADEVARTVLGMLALISAVFVVIGLIWTPAIVTMIAGGFKGEKRDLTIELVRIMFPGISFLVVSAWCLAILNSHGRFFLSYVAPVAWNIAILSALVAFHGRPLEKLAVDLAWAALVGCALQLGVQFPSVWRIMSVHWRKGSIQHTDHVREVLLSSLPVIFTRGVVQVSAWVDSWIASWLGTGAITAFMNAQQLCQLPIGLFGQAVSSAALPSMSMARAASEPETIRRRLVSSQRMIAVFIVPSMFAFLLFGDVMVAMLLQRGRFTAANTLYVWGILAGSAVGLMATTIGRLYASAFYALGDTRTPTKFAIIRVALVASLGYLLALPVPHLLGIPIRWGAAGLTVSAGFSGWIEFALLRAALERRIGSVSISLSFVARTWLAALLGAALATGLRWVIPIEFLVFRGLVILGVYGLAYLAIAHGMGLANFQDVIRQVLRRPARAQRV